ncbi:outer membrane beta-barrel protein [Chitinophaga sp.]|uniref:outer membrane beta-barrel protein n=1 Tax=Chitinophaga sp. TaxID=1869181 RepID=UPI0031DB2BA8
MKKLQALTLALMAVLFFSTTAFAQTQKGNILIGSDITDLGLNFQKSSTQFTFNLNPKAAWFINDGLALGGYVNFGLVTSNGAGSDVSYGIGALARYYPTDKNVRKLEFSKRARFFVEGNAGFGGTNPASGASTNGVELGVGPGISYFITPNVALETLFKYNIIIGGGNSTTAQQLKLGVGFQIFLPGAKAKEIMREEGRNMK